MCLRDLGDELNRYSNRKLALEAERAKLELQRAQYKVDRGILLGSPRNPLGRSGLIGQLSSRETKDWRGRAAEHIDSEILRVKCKLLLNADEARTVVACMDELAERIKMRRARRNVAYTGVPAGYRPQPMTNEGDDPPPRYRMVESIYQVEEAPPPYSVVA